MKKVLTALQVLSGILIYCLMGGVDNGADFGQAIVLIILLLLSMAIFQAIKNICQVLEHREADKTNNKHCYYNRYGTDSQGVKW